MGQTSGRILSDSDRDRVLRAAAELCAEFGYEALDVDLIARRAEVSSRRFRALFPDREAAVKAAIDAILVAVMERVASLYSPDLAESESGVFAIKAILELMAENPEFAHVSYIAARQMTPKQLREPLDMGTRLLTALMERFWEQSVSASQPPRAARAALGGAEAVVRREVARGRAAELPRLLPDFVYSALVPFLGQKEALRLARRSLKLPANSPK